MKIEKSSSDLESEIIFRDMCAHCGTCGAFCPHIEYQDDGNPKILDSCNETVGVCYNSCPRANLNISSLEQKKFGKVREDPILGIYSEKILVKSGKNGILNALIETAFKNNLIDAMIVPENKSKGNNVAVVVTDSSKVPALISKNNTYIGPLVMGINDGFEKGKSVGLIGNPCHHQGVAKIKYSDFRTRMESLKLNIGVMCMAGGGKGCKYCIDYTGEFSDVSYGEAGQENGNAVLLIRTETGKKLVDAALNDKAIIKVNDDPNLEKILGFAAKKKKNGVKNILKMDIGKIGYLELNDKELATFFG